MTNPTPPLYKQGDVVLIDGLVTTITSWPATNEGYFAWEREDADSAITRGTSFYGQNEAGEPLQVAVVPQPYDGPAPANAIGVDAETGLVANVPTPDAAPVVVEDVPETDVEDAEPEADAA